MEAWDRHADPVGDKSLAAKKRLAFAGDLADPRAPEGMALVSRWDVNLALSRLTWLEARFENTACDAIPQPQGPAPDGGVKALREALEPFACKIVDVGESETDNDIFHNHMEHKLRAQDYGWRTSDAHLPPSPPAQSMMQTETRAPPGLIAAREVCDG